MFEDIDSSRDKSEIFTDLGFDRNSFYPFKRLVEDYPLRERISLVLIFGSLFIMLHLV